MNEEEILEQLKEAISEWYLAQEDGKYSVEFEEYDVKAIEGLLSLYQQEKEKNKKLEEQRNELAMILSDKEDERVELNKVIDMMIKDMPSDVVAKICEKRMDLEMDCYADVYDEKSCSECIKEYYFNKVKEKNNEE